MKKMSALVISSGPGELRVHIEQYSFDITIVASKTGL